MILVLDLGDPLGVDEHVARLEVAVEEAVEVDEGHALGNVPRDREERRVPIGVRLEGGLVDDVEERGLHELHDDTRHAGRMVERQAHREQHIRVVLRERRIGHGTLAQQRLRKVSS